MSAIQSGSKSEEILSSNGVKFVKGSEGPFTVNLNLNVGNTSVNIIEVSIDTQGIAQVEGKATQDGIATAGNVSIFIY